MDSRMDKYYRSDQPVGKRSQKNERLYKEVNKQTLEDFNVNSNVSVLSDNGTSINLDDLRELLDKRYQKNNKRKKIQFDLPTSEEELEQEKTKEYDINAILEKAHENKVVDYEKERLKKIRDTQYDILKGLNLDKEEEEEQVSPEEKKLMTLINTITANELNHENSGDPLDLFADLKGDENTKVLPPLKEETKSYDVTKSTNVVKENKKSKIDDSFFTKSFNLSKNDFDDFKDLDDDGGSNKVIVIILVIIVILALLIGLFIFLNMHFDWGII